MHSPFHKWYRTRWWIVTFSQLYSHIIFNHIVNYPARGLSALAHLFEFLTLNIIIIPAVAGSPQLARKILLFSFSPESMQTITNVLALAHTHIYTQICTTNTHVEKCLTLRLLKTMCLGGVVVVVSRHNKIIDLFVGRRREAAAGCVVYLYLLFILYWHNIL